MYLSAYHLAVKAIPLFDLWGYLSYTLFLNSDTV